MNLLSLIVSLEKEGKSALEIAQELRGRGIATDRGKTITPDMVVGFLRFAGTSPAALPGREAVTGAVWGSRGAPSELGALDEDHQAASGPGKRNIPAKQRQNRWNPHRYFSPAEAAEITRLYQHEHMGPADIAAKLGLSSKRVNPFCAHLAGYTVPPGEITEFIDEQGRKILRCPPAYARGVYPQRNVGMPVRTGSRGE